MSEVKAYYRSYFAQCMPFLKMSYFLRKAKVNSGNFSHFMDDAAYDMFMSEEKLKEIANLISKALDEIT